MTYTPARKPTTKKGGTMNRSKQLQEAESIINDFNAGKIDFIEFQRRNYKLQQKTFLPQLMEYRDAGQWQKFISLSLTICELLPIAFNYFDEIPDELKYDFAIEAYINHGDNYPEVRKAVRHARKYGRPELPPEILAAEKITVYRAGEEPITECKKRISWTTDKDTALFFLNTYIGRHATHLYKAEIKTADIIAYTNARNEKEIMQYNKVFNIKELTPEQIQDDNGI